MILRRLPKSSIIQQRASSIIPESFKSPTIDPMIAEETQIMSTYAPEPQTFHAKVAGGFNGHFAKLFDSRANPSATIALHERLVASGIKITNRLTYNYLLNAYLKEKNNEKAFGLIVEMEKQGIQPDKMTFEILLKELSIIVGLELAVEELFVGMQKKWGIIGGPLAWTSRISVWIHRKTSKRAIGYYRHFVNPENKKTVDPALPKMTSIHVHLLKIAVIRQCWPLAEEIISYIKKNNIHIRQMDCQNIAELATYFIEPEALPTAVFIANSLKSAILEEGYYCRSLYFASKCGKPGAELADLAMDKLTKLYASTDGITNIPRYYCEAYVDMIEKPADDSDTLSLFTPISQKTKTRYHTYKAALRKDE